jgi:hypothetical protein
MPSSTVTVSLPSQGVQNVFGSGPGIPDGLVPRWKDPNNVVDQSRCFYWSVCTYQTTDSSVHTALQFAVGNIGDGVIVSLECLWTARVTLSSGGLSIANSVAGKICNAWVNTWVAAQKLGNDVIVWQSGSGMGVQCSTSGVNGTLICQGANLTTVSWQFENFFYIG